MGFKYAIFHWSFHLLPTILFYFIFKLNFFEFFLVLVAAGIVDIDHLPRIRKKGLVGWAKESMNFHIPRRYPLHNFLAIPIFLLLSLFIFYPEFFLIGLSSLAITLHLLWDFFEDIFIFGMRIKHWKV